MAGGFLIEMGGMKRGDGKEYEMGEMKRRDEVDWEIGMEGEMTWPQLVRVKKTSSG